MTRETKLEASWWPSRSLHSKDSFKRWATSWVVPVDLSRSRDIGLTIRGLLTQEPEEMDIFWGKKWQNRVGMFVYILMVKAGKETIFTLQFMRLFQPSKFIKWTFYVGVIVATAFQRKQFGSSSRPSGNFTTPKDAFSSPRPWSRYSHSKMKKH